MTHALSRSACAAREWAIRLEYLYLGAGQWKPDWELRCNINLSLLTRPDRDTGVNIDTRAVAENG
jgi:hypothetical protein